MHCFGRQIERCAGGEINPRLGLVVAGDFGAEDGVPGQIVAAGEIDHQRNVAVRHRRDAEFAFESFERRRHFRPGIEPVPGKRQFVQHRVGQILQAKARQKAFEIAPVQHVELAERDAAGAHLLHAALVLAPPGIGESRPVEPLASSGVRMRSASRATDVRQSTRVPKTSKNSAFGGIEMLGPELFTAPFSSPNGPRFGSREWPLSH